jgi:outer membrane cobalamin receptor
MKQGITVLKMDFLSLHTIHFIALFKVDFKLRLFLMTFTDFFRRSEDGSISRLFIALALVALISGAKDASGQSSGPVINGSVTDAVTMLSLEGVNVVVMETSQGTVTDREGKFRIVVLSEGAFTVRASMTGYKTERVKVDLKTGAEAQINIGMASQIYQIDSVNVTAQREIRNLLKAPYTEPFSLQPAISTIKYDEMLKQGALTVIDAVNYVPGGLTETRGRQVKQFFSVRGQKYPYPDYAVNGVWQQEFQELPYFFSASDIEEIEIVRSSAALLTGLSGMAGLINIRTKQYTVPETSAEIEYGTFNSFHGHISTGGKAGRIGYRLGAGYDKSDGPDGKHANETMANINAGIDWILSDRLALKATLFYLDGKRQLRLAEPPADQRYINTVQSFDPYRALISNVKVAYRPSKSLSTEVQLFYSYRNPTFNDEVKNTSSNERDYEAGLNIMQSVSLSKSNTLRFGGLYNRWIAPEGKRFYIGKRCDTETYSGVIVDEQQIGHVTLDGGIRWTRAYLNEYAAFNIEGEGGLFKNVTPIVDSWEPAIMQGNMGATWRYNNDLSFYFNAAAGQINPRRGALNEDMDELKNETRVKLDFGTALKFARSGKMSLTAFRVMQKDAIALSGTTYTDTITGMVRELYLNRGQDQTGIEFEISSPPVFGMINSFLNFTLMRSELEKEGETITNRENPVFITAGGVYFKKKRTDLNIMCKYVSRFENERFASAAAGPQPLGDYLNIDVTGGYSFNTRIPVRLYFKIRNLTGKKYSTVIGYPDYGRMIYLGMNLNFRHIRDAGKL